MHRVIKATVGNKFYQCVKRSILEIFQANVLGSMRCMPTACMKLRLPVGLEGTSVGTVCSELLKRSAQWSGVGIVLDGQSPIRLERRL